LRNRSTSSCKSPTLRACMHGRVRIPGVSQSGRKHTSRISAHIYLNAYLHMGQVSQAHGAAVGPAWQARMGGAVLQGRPWGARTILAAAGAPGGCTAAGGTLRRSAAHRRRAPALRVAHATTRGASVTQRVRPAQRGAQGGRASCARRVEAG
jgi:hypothetical protein